MQVVLSRPSIRIIEEVCAVLVRQSPVDQYGDCVDASFDTLIGKIDHSLRVIKPSKTESKSYSKRKLVHPDWTVTIMRHNQTRYDVSPDGRFRRYPYVVLRHGVTVEDFRKHLAMLRLEYS